MLIWYLKNSTTSKHFSLCSCEIKNNNSEAKIVKESINISKVHDCLH